MTKLYQLSNGNWVRLDTITSIVVLERTQCWNGGPIYPARIIIYAGHKIEVCMCDDKEQACKMRDELAALVNCELAGDK